MDEYDLAWTSAEQAMCQKRFEEHNEKRRATLDKARIDAASRAKQAEKDAKRVAGKEKYEANWTRHMQKVNSNVYLRLAEAVINKREALGLSQGDLAEVFSIPESTLAEIESGQRINFCLGLKFVSVLQIRADLFFDEILDLSEEKRRLADAVASKTKALDEEMVTLQRMMRELEDKKRLFSRIRGDS